MKKLLGMNSGVYGKKLGEEGMMIQYWCRSNLSEKEVADIYFQFKTN